MAWLARSMQNQESSMSTMDQLNHMPAEVMGRASMPAPMAVPATIMEPPRVRWKPSPKMNFMNPSPRNQTLRDALPRS